MMFIKYLSSILLITLVCVASLWWVVNHMSPEGTTMLPRILFIASTLLSLTGIFTLGGFLIRRNHHVVTSCRQAFLLALLVVVGLFLFRAQLLSIGAILALTATAACIEWISTKYTT